MKIIDMPIGNVIPYKNNPRRNDAAVKPVMESLKEFGWKQPIVIDKDNVIVCGHTRLRAAKRLKMKTVPCVMADDLTPEQIKAFRLADNKTAEFASWDMDMLNSELLDIKGIDMGDFGFDMPEPEPEEDAFDVDAAHEEAAKNPVTTLGTLYQLGNHRLLCGDSTNRTDVARLLGGQMVDMVFTDPPYNVAYQGGTKDKLTIKNDSMSEAEFKNFLDAVFDNYFAAMKPGAKHRFFGGRKLSTVIPDNYPVEVGYDADGHQLIHISIGLKTVCLRADNVEAVDTEEVNSVIHVDKPTRNAEHPTMKPIALCAKCIKNSCQQGDSVLDLFGGSGSTLIACEQINRQCYSMELDPVYCDVIVKRWEALTGRKAEVIGGS